MTDSSKTHHDKKLRDPVPGIEHPLPVGTVGTAEKALPTLHPVADDSTTAVHAERGQFVNGTLKAVKRIATLSNHGIESFIVLVVTGEASSHIQSKNCLLTVNR